jgi:hypothetical protein
MWRCFLKSVLQFLTAACVFSAGFYAAIEWPHLRSRAEAAIEPVNRFLRSPQLAEVRLHEIQALGAELAEIRMERDKAILKARRAGEQYAALCEAIRSLDVAELGEPILVQE